MVSEHSNFDCKWKINSSRFEVCSLLGLQKNLGVDVVYLQCQIQILKFEIPRLGGEICVDENKLMKLHIYHHIMETWIHLITNTTSYLKTSLSCGKTASLLHFTFPVCLIDKIFSDRTVPSVLTSYWNNLWTLPKIKLNIPYPYFNRWIFCTT